MYSIRLLEFAGVVDIDFILFIYIANFGTDRNCNIVVIANRTLYCADKYESIKGKATVYMRSH